ncbi:PD-(D/E)XK nuclease family protein [Pyrobaculum neutrophilum]|uniref:PD-(D/E)XK nuclease family protein n=1 Tax=Pyrobaculum neutrophilum TaxID=70771 RepID=UPI0011E4E504|nr:DUF3782 domain-containing protein [Pyrobaculum neutrophilum]
MGLDLKRELLRLLREDEEFRYAVVGLLGIADLRTSLDSLIKAVGELRDVVAKHSEEIDKLRSAVEELRKAVEALTEDVKRHSEAIHAMQNSIERLTSSVTALGYRHGLFTEEAFRESIRYLLGDLLKIYQIKRWTYYDSEGFVFGRPSVIDVDVLIRDGEHILVGYKAGIDRGDVAELYREGLLYERVNKVRPRLLIVGPAIRKRALELARELGVEVRAPEVV